MARTNPRPSVTSKTLATLMLVVAMAASACGETLAGTPVAAMDAPPAPQAPPGPGHNDQEAGEKWLETIDPCVLLTAEHLRMFGARDGERDDVAGTRGCVWTIPDGNGLFSVSFVSDKGIDDVVVGQGEVSEVRVVDRRAKIVKEINRRGECMLAMATTRNSRVDVDSLYRVDTVTACERAMKVAELVEPQLPEGE